MKPLKPSAREKKRYLLIKGEIADVEKAILNFVGVLGMSKTGLYWIKKSKTSAVICINREMLDSVKASLCVWPKRINVAKVSGSVKNLK